MCIIGLNGNQSLTFEKKILIKQPSQRNNKKKNTNLYVEIDRKQPM